MDEQREGTGSGRPVTEIGASGTSGGRAGTSGMRPWALRAMLFALFFGYALIQMVANVYSQFADRRNAGVEIPGWQVWTSEITSVAAWTIVIFLVWWAVLKLRPPRLAWPLALLGHAAMTVPVSLGHIGLMVALRKLVWSANGAAYQFAAHLPDGLLYEYRKDLATYIQMALVLALIEWLVARYAAKPEPVPAAEPAMLEVADGAITHRVPVDEIDHVAAAGNYVELSWRGRTLLHRATLSSLEAELAAHGFVRIHRSRLVRRPAIRRVETNQSGDFEVVLESGETLKGSRRYREGLEGERNPTLRSG